MPVRSYYYGSETGNKATTVPPDRARILVHAKLFAGLATLAFAVAIGYVMATELDPSSHHSLESLSYSSKHYLNVDSRDHIETKWISIKPSNPIWAMLFKMVT